MERFFWPYILTPFPSLLRKEGRSPYTKLEFNENGNLVFLLNHYTVSRTKKLDFEIVKKRARKQMEIPHI